MKIKGYTLDYSKKLEDINAYGYVYTHDKTKAKAIIIDNDDENKVFTVGFRTPPKNSTGVAHILEHSVLCGSERFPLKDPFVELVKGSLNTFLNAMTYPDKTIYPVASTNDKDFQNLMEVYLDAVFAPNVYKKKEIFLQEGWHHHLENKEDDIYYNGVVYNEMKGAYSSAERILEESTGEFLFPDTQYGVSSGGNPINIPDLSYDEFLDFHSTYYHPSNSYIYIYGKVDAKEKLEYISENYLDRYEYKAIDSNIKEQDEFDEPKYSDITYSIANDESEENKAFYSYSVCVGRNDDLKKGMALDILLYLLINSSASKVKKEMIASGLVSNIRASFVDDIRQSYIGITGYNCKLDSLKEFENKLNDLILAEINKGFDKEALLGAINIEEFRYLESDFGDAPKGLYYMMDMFKGMLYNEKDAFLHIEKSNIYKELKEEINTNYFENLALENIVNNKFKVLLEAKPEKGYNDKIEKEIVEKLKKYKENLTESDLEALVEQTHKLIKFQTEPNTKEELDKLPKLDRCDLEKEKEEFKIQEDDFEVKAYYNNSFANGIAYMNQLYQIGGQYNPSKMSIITKLLGNIDTEKYSYDKLKNKINLISGGIKFSIISTTTKSGEVKYYLDVNSKSISENLDDTFELTREILLHSKFNDLDRFREILLNLRTNLESNIKESGHIYSYYKAAASFDPMMYIMNNVAGVGLYDEVKYLTDNFDNIGKEYLSELENILKAVMAKNVLTINFNGSDEDYSKFKNKISNLLKNINLESKVEPCIKVEEEKKIGIKTSSQVQYVTRTGNYKKSGLKFDGGLNVLKTILSYEYLWENVRVLGGAYGCSGDFSKNGVCVLTSYRDPNLRKTNEVYEKLPKWLEEFDADEDRMLKYIIGSLSNHDKPMSNVLQSFRELISKISGYTSEDIYREREEILSCTAKNISSYSKHVKALLDEGAFCVIGNDLKVEECKDMFDAIRSL